MTSDVFWIFLTCQTTLIRYFTTYLRVKLLNLKYSVGRCFLIFNPRFVQKQKRLASFPLHWIWNQNKLSMNFWVFLTNKWTKLHEASTRFRILTLCNWHEAGHFPPPVLFESDFVSWIFTKNFQTSINWVNLTARQAHWVLWKMSIGGSKDEHFPCFHSSCQLGLTRATPFF